MLVGFQGGGGGSDEPLEPPPPLATGMNSSISFCRVVKFMQESTDLRKR